MQQEFVPRGDALKGHVCVLTVRNADHCSVGSSDSGLTKAYGLDRYLSIAHLQIVSHADGLVEDKRDSADYVFQCLLCGECNGNSTNAESSQCCGRVYPEVIQSHDYASGDDEQVGYPTREMQH